MSSPHLHRLLPPLTGGLPPRLRRSSIAVPLCDDHQESILCACLWKAKDAHIVAACLVNFRLTKGRSPAIDQYWLA
ncbi:hypothetical protein L1987_64192 [Smallanthus sonchifolius]|uniref:Uncharacterized protein n=1 Tax=Smallanthus sonchifolius TaxID=185202 RepID=A0ACB9CFD6_9ASTR|nr:hypothetical protein L1987_64192 [Smallanthus sonchifolius]